VFFPSFGVLDVDDTPLAPMAEALGVELFALVPPVVVVRVDDILANRSLTSPCSANGAGSIPLLVNLSESDAKQRNAPSAT
jgi:hypothetical protein